jgi:hypothetical protein
MSLIKLPADLGDVIDSALERVVAMNRAPAEAWVRRIRAKHPTYTPFQVVNELEREYRRAVIGLGAAGGAVAAAPGLSTGAGLATGPAEIVAFLELTAVFAHAVADVHGIHVDDPEAKRLLVLAVTLGGSGAELVEQLAGGTTKWGPLLLTRTSSERAKEINKVLRRRLLMRYGSKQGALLLGRALPFFVGSAVGAAGNAALAQGSIAATRRAFGSPTSAMPADDVVDGEVVAEAAQTAGG